MKFGLLILSVLCVKSALACGEHDPRLWDGEKWGRAMKGSNNWDAAFEDVVHRIDRAIPELGLLTDRQPSISGFPDQPIWMARDMDQP